MKKILIVTEHNHQSLSPITLSLITAAAQLKGIIHLIIIGSNCQKAAEEARLLPHVERVLVADNPVYAYPLAENSALLLSKISSEYSYILSASSTFGKNLLPRLAGLLNLSMISDVVEIVSEDTFVRPLYAGNVQAKVQSSEPIKILTIRTSAFPKSAITAHHNAPLESLEVVIPNEGAIFEECKLTTSNRPELTNAKIIIAGGRGLKNADNFALLNKLADQLGAAIGASRAAVDAGFAPNDYQIGQTGKIVAPNLYIAIGISGAVQHLAGMKDSKVVVAINNDPNAPIFEVADYILVGDLFSILPALEIALLHQA